MAETKGLRGTEDQGKTRLLLALWDMGGAKAEVKKGELTQRIQRTNEKAADYQGIFQELEKAGAIALSKNKISLSSEGVQLLGEKLNSVNFEFDSQIGAKTANALLKWLREMGTLSNGATAPGVQRKAEGKAIASYDEFKPVALDVYDQLNRDYNLDNLVPIYRIRREIGERVTRSQFSEWLLEMQANDLVQLIGGEMTDITPDKAEDSIKTELGGIRYYVKRLSSKN
ncbi:hypothetical protein NDI37_15970 [Funiculus sociatus GB2-A5]|uniref:Uncharacterized protein n=1 Tax=Funiculus sociatus GB2-A5 TaxID=2933946 RepID=A0ABV0JRA6_9CYAN|nr:MULTISPECIES: hypothetical protein [unclassified Trichocoleus]MBD1906179.1 hypothetical protein [Trichocoleus sp. FACHB-832]MBD2061200.1 hypothetical protein [Trichocoleus sp. FACHB-6]